MAKVWSYDVTWLIINVLTANVIAAEGRANSY